MTDYDAVLDGLVEKAGPATAKNLAKQLRAYGTWRAQGKQDDFSWSGPSLARAALEAVDVPSLVLLLREAESYVRDFLETSGLHPEDETVARDLIARIDALTCINPSEIS